MIRYILRQLMLLIITLLGISLVMFAFLYWLPIDRTDILVGETGGSADRYSYLKQTLGLNTAIWQQYIHYVQEILYHGDLGMSRITQHSISKELLTHAPASLELLLCAITLALVLGIPAGVIAAHYRRRWPDYMITAPILIAYSMPVFWWGLLLILSFSLSLSWVPAAGRIDFLFDIPQTTGFLLWDSLHAEGPDAQEAFWDVVSHLILPTLTLATIPFAFIARTTRTAMIDALNMDYVRTAQSKGVRPTRVLWQHAFPNAALSIMRNLSLQIGVLVNALIITEVLYSWPGIGKWLINMIHQRDYVAIQGGVLAISCAVLLLSTFFKIIRAFLNPRIRHP